MSDWSGFTDAELRKLKNQNSTDPVKVARLQAKKTTPSKEKKLSRKINTTDDNLSVNEHQITTVTIPQKNNEKLIEKSKSEIRTEIRENKDQSINDLPIKKVAENVDKEAITHKENSISLSESINLESNGEVISPSKLSEAVIPSKSKESESNEEVISPLKLSEEQDISSISLEQLEKQQKIIEEQNKKKARLIKETLQQRFKETLSETAKLKEMQKELQKLDRILQVDVDVLRCKIEEASVLYSHAEKRYQLAEEEYVQAKLDYYKQKEMKEQLTEHLCSIIQQNEMRKSTKLEEILSKLASGKEYSTDHSAVSNEKS